MHSFHFLVGLLYISSVNNFTSSQPVIFYLVSALLIWPSNNKVILNWYPQSQQGKENPMNKKTVEKSM